MTYKQLQAALKELKAQGKTTIKLNSKIEVLQAEYDRLTVIKKEVKATVKEVKKEISSFADEVLVSAVDHKTYTGVPKGITQTQLRKANEQSVLGNISSRHQAISQSNLYSKKSTPKNNIKEFATKVAVTYTKKLGNTERQAIANLQQGVKNVGALIAGVKFGLSASGRQQYYNENNRVQRAKFDRNLMTA